MTKEDLILEKLARIEERLEGVARVEQQLQGFAGPWDSMTDLGRDLSFLTTPAVKQLTEELVEVETGFQLEDVFTLIKRLLPSLKYLAWSLTTGKPGGLVAGYGALIEAGGTQARRLPG